MAAAQAPATTHNMGVAPDNVRGLATQALRKGRVSRFGAWRRVEPGAVRLSYGKCHREQTAGAACTPGGEPEATPTARLFWSSAFGKGEKVG